MYTIMEFNFFLARFMPILVLWLKFTIFSYEHKMIESRKIIHKIQIRRSRPFSSRILSLPFLAIILFGCSPRPQTPEEVATSTPTALPVSGTAQPKEHVLRDSDSVDVNNPWSELPEIEIPDPPRPFKPFQEKTSEQIYHYPQGEPEGRHIAMTNAVWRAGWVNGQPREPDAKVPDGEYGPDYPGERYIHIDQPSQLPPFLEPGQTLVVRVPPLPQNLYHVRVATNAGGESNDKIQAYTTAESVAGRHLHLRWNDRIIWKRDHAPFLAIIEGLVSPDEVRPEGNVFSIHNAGTRTAPLDAVWIEPYLESDGPYGIVFKEASWLNRGDSAWVRQVLLPVTLPLPPEESIELPSIELIPPVDVSDLRSRWAGVGERFRALENMGHPDVEILRGWLPELRQAVDRGMVPSLRLKHEGERWVQNLDSVAYVFGDLINIWMLPGNVNPETAVAQLNTHIRNPTVYTRNLGGTTDLAVPIPLDAWMDFAFVFYANRTRSLYFDFVISERDLKRSTDLRGLSLGFHDLDAYHYMDRNFHTINFHKSLVEGLMYSRHSAIVRGGEPAGPFFPDGSDAGDHHWRLLKHVFRFGGPSHRKSHGNLLAANENLDLGSSLWAVADNGKDSVHVLIHNPTNRNGMEAVIEAPIPWSGPTRILHHHVATSWSRTSKGEVVSTNSLIEVDPFKNITYANSTSTKRGWLRHQLKLQGMHLLELSPEGTVEHRDIHAPESIGFGAMETVEHLFKVGRRPPPPWWSRRELVTTHRARWERFGPAILRTGVNATLGDSPDWKALKDVKLAVEGTFPGTSPLRDKSVQMGFPVGADGRHSFVYAFYDKDIVKDAKIVGMWIRAHVPPDFDAPPNWFRAKPIATFYMGILPYRQKIEMEYDTWHFVTSPATYWPGAHYRAPRPRIHFQHDPEAEHHPLLEVNDFAAYGLKVASGITQDSPTLGFVRESDSGALALMVLGKPGAKGHWRQRLDRLVDPGNFKRTIDESLLVTAESPDDPAPEEVFATLNMHESSRVLEVRIDRMPPPPSPAFRRSIRREFPIIAERLQLGDLGAVLWIEQTGPKNPENKP